MVILLWVFVGLVAGWLASLVMHSSHRIMVDLVLGLVGSLVGAFVVRAVMNAHGPFTNTRVEQFRTTSQSLTLTSSSVVSHIAVAFVGALLLLVIYRLLFGRRGGLRRA